MVPYERETAYKIYSRCLSAKVFLPKIGKDNYYSNKQKVLIIIQELLVEEVHWCGSWTIH